MIRTIACDASCLHVKHHCAACHCSATNANVNAIANLVVNTISVPLIMTLQYAD